jgi:glycosyltransferase involved in cell wall biosynthesis
MRIIIFGNYPPPYGGVPGHLRELSSYLSSLGNEVHIVSGGVGGKLIVNKYLTIHKLGRIQKLFLFFWSILRGYYLGGWRLLLTLPKHFFRYQYLLEYLRRNPWITKNVDLVLSYNIILFSPVAANLAKELGKPHIVSVFGELYNPIHFEARAISLFEKTLAGAARVVSCSEHCGKSVRDAFGTPVAVIKYGVDVRNFYCLDDLKRFDLRKACGMPDHAFVVGFIGRFSDELGFSDFLTMVDEVVQPGNSIYVVIAGNPENNLKLAKKAKRRNQERIKLFVNPSFETLPQLINLIDLCVIPSRGARTCSSLAAMEALSCGVRVLAYTTGGIPEILMGVLGARLVPEGDTGLLLKAALEIYSERPHLSYPERQLVRSGAQQFDIKNTNLQYTALLTSLVSNAKS